MQPLDTYELVMNFAILIIMPLLIWVNLRQNASTNLVSAYLWEEHTNFMRVSLVVLGMITLFSAVTLLGHFGVLTADAVEITDMVIGIPFLFLAIVEVVLAVMGVVKFLRGRRAASKI